MKNSPYTIRKRVQPVSPSISFLLRARTSLQFEDGNTVYARRVLSRKSFDTASVTEESDFIMPRSSPRLELCQALSANNYVAALWLEQQSLQMQLQHFMLLAMKATRRKVRLRSRSTSRIQKYCASRTRSLRTKILMLFSMMQYVTNSTLYNQRQSIVMTLLTERYIAPRVPLPKSLAWLADILPNSPDRIFEMHTRMTRRSFSMLVTLLERRTPHIFTNARGRKQLPLHIQPHLGLFCLGFYGNGASFESARVKFGYGVGTIHNVRKRVINALITVSAEFIKWPTEEKRRALCRQVKRTHGYHSAFFLVDGTTHSFAAIPSFERSSWFDRKSKNSMQALVTCDVNLRVIHLVVGWPGSAHDSRVLGSAAYKNKDQEAEYFTGEQHGLGDAAFGIHKRVVPNYKEPLASIPENREYNLRHSSLRVRSEHTIGHVKNRFQGLRDIRLRLRNKDDVREIVKYLTAGYVLHNILLEFKDKWNPPAPEIDEVGDSDMADLQVIESTPLQEEYDDPYDEGVQFREKVKHQVLEFIGFE